MSDSFTETTHRSWFTRIKDNLVGTLFGLLLFLAAFVVLFWNEGRAVKTHKTLQEGAGAVISVGIDQVNPANENKLVHVSGKVQTTEELSDPIFEVTVNAIRLNRKVEMLQWKQSSKSETRKKLGGGEETVTTYTYSKQWSESLIDSSQFKKPEGHDNPVTMIMESEQWQAENVSLGAFKLSPSQISSMGGGEALALSDENKLSKKVAGKARLVNGIMYLGSKKHDKIGDYRIGMEVVNPSDVSIVAAQAGDTFKAYQTEAGGTIQMLSAGIKPATAMFEAAEAANTTMTWILRFVGLMMMFLGLKMIVSILTVLADLVPFIGSMVGTLTGVVAFLLALSLSLVTIGVAWIYYRPLIGGALLAVAVALFVFARMRAGRENTNEPAEAVAGE